MVDNSIITQDSRQLAEGAGASDENVVPTPEREQTLDPDQSDDRSDTQKLRDLAIELGLDQP